MTGTKERVRVALSRGVDAVEIPAGTTTTLPAGMEVTIVQTLGGNFTVSAGPYGMLYRVAAQDADALGREPPTQPKPLPVAQPGDAPGEPTHRPAGEEQIRELLKTIYDPEIPVNIHDLGLIYGVVRTPTDDGRVDVRIDMTLTAPGCGMAGVLKSDVEAKVAALAGVREVEVEIVWDPPWDRDRMSDAAKLQLGML